MQKFYKGRTNNHLTWVMVDATDFATPESALSAAMKIKIYGKLRGATGVNFVSSGTGSLTNDIQHVGASALGIYTIALAKADLSDASAAWYDQYVVSLSATGAAYQVLVVDGGIDASTILALSGIISDAHSAAAQANSRVLLTQSLASDAASAAIQANSRVLLVQSRLSDLDSRLASDTSDILSALVALSDATSNAYSAAVVGASRILLVQSRLSDLDSRLVSDVSDIRSMLTHLSGVQSDIYSGVQLLQSAFIGHAGSTASQVADASTLEIDGIDHDDQFNGYFVKVLGGSQVDELRLIVDTDATSSKIIVKPAFLSRLASGVDFVIVAGAPFLSNIHSDIKSATAGLSGMISDVDSALTSQFGYLSDAVSNAMSAVLLTQSLASDAASAAAQGNSRVLLVQSRLSDLDSRLASDTSDILSALVALSDATSNAYSAAAQGASRVLLVQSRLSDLDSRLVSEFSDVYSRLSDMHSDLRSQIGAITATLSASDISDIASAVWAHTVGTRVDSRILVNQSYLSDIRSHVSDLQSDFQSRVPKRVATDSQLSDVHSDLKSAIGAITVNISASDVSDIASAVVAALPITSAVSDIYSLLSSLESEFLSRVPKRVATDSQLSDLASDVKSAVAVGNSRALVVQSRLSDFDSRLASEVSDVYSAVVALSDATSNAYSAAAQGSSRALLVQSRLSDLDSRLSSELSDVYSLLSDLTSDFGSRVPKRVATDSQLSDLASDLRSVAVVAQSQVSDIYSLLSDLHSDVGVLSGVASDVYSAVAAGVEVGASSMSDLRSAITANGVLRAGVEPAAVVGHTDTLAGKVDWLTALSRNKVTQTATVQSLRNDADSADIASAAVSDDGTTFTRGEFGN